MIYFQCNDLLGNLGIQVDLYFGMYTNLNTDAEQMHLTTQKKTVQEWLEKQDKEVKLPACPQTPQI